MQGPSRLRHVIFGIAIGGISTMAVGSLKAAGCLAVPQSGWPTIVRLRQSPKRWFQSVSVRREQTPKENANLERLSELETSYARQGFVIETGWATMPLADTPNREVAAARAEVLKAEEQG